MSIIAHIMSLEGDGRLRRFVPKSNRPPTRRLYLTVPAMRDFDDPAGAVNTLVGRGYVEAAYARWTLGDRIYGDERKGRFIHDYVTRNCDDFPI